MHELRARVLRDEETLTTSPSPSKGEQQALADRAIENLARVKKMIEDGHVSRLDALRLTNDFRPPGAGAERGRVKKMIEAGHVSRLDALRLNNDFRRIGQEKERIIRHELATVTN